MKHDMDEQINKLKKYYLSKLPDKISAIENAWNEFLEAPDTEKLQVLWRQTSNLSSSAGAYGYKELSDTAKKIYKLLREQTKFDLDFEKKQKISNLIVHLRDVFVKIKY